MFVTRNTAPTTEAVSLRRMLSLALTTRSVL